MNTIYVCQDAEIIQKVYKTDAPVYKKEDLLREPERFSDVEYVFSTWGMPTLSEDEIAACLPKLKAVFYGAGTVQAFARPFLNRGIKVFSAWAANAVPVAEYTVAQIVLANKGFFHTVRYADWEAARDTYARLPGNYGVKVGIIGAGMIGKLVIQALKAYALEVLVFDPFLADEKAEELGVTKVELDTLFAECRVVSNHLANNEQTRGMLNGALFEKMPPYATFLNTGRGAQVVEDELINVLKARPDLTAVLDVTVAEPPAADSDFYRLPNCFLTPHIAGSGGNEVQRMGQYMKEEFARFTNGEPCLYEVTTEMLKTMA